MPAKLELSSALMLAGFRRLVRAKRALRTVLGVAAVAFLGAVPGLSSAHAIVVGAQPAMNSTVAQGDVELRLDFNSRIDGQRSRMLLRRPDGTEAPVTLASDPPPNALVGRAQATMAGRWKLDWQVLSLDGHITRGEVVFFVRERAAAP